MLRIELDFLPRGGFKYAGIGKGRRMEAILPGHTEPCDLTWIYCPRMAVDIYDSSFPREGKFLQAAGDNGI